MTDDITVSRELLRQVLETLTCTGEDDDPGHRCGYCDDYVDRNGPVRKALRAALEQPAPVQEPAAEILSDVIHRNAKKLVFTHHGLSLPVGTKLYTATQLAPASEPVLLQCLGCERVGTQEQLSASTDCDCWLHTQPAPVQEPEKLNPLTQLQVAYVMGLRDSNSALQAAPVQEPVCRGCGIPINDIHMSTCPTKKWPMYVTPADAAQPAPVQEQQFTADELDLMRQWFESMQDTNRSFVIDADKKLHQKIIAAIQAAPRAEQPRKAVKLSDSEILAALEVEYVSSAQNRHLFLSDARTIEAAVWAKLGVEP